MGKKRPLADEDNPAKRLRYEEAALEGLKRQVAEKESLVRSLRREVHARQMPGSIAELERAAHCSGLLHGLVAGSSA